MILHERGDDDARLNRLAAGSYMTPDPITVASEVSARIAVTLLKEHKIGALPVVDRGQHVGIITTRDLLASYVTLLESQPEQC